MIATSPASPGYVLKTEQSSFSSCIRATDGGKSAILSSTLLQGWFVMIQRKGILVIVFVVLSAVAGIAQSSAVQPRITQAVDERQLVKIPRTVHPLAQARYDGGAAPDDMPLERVHLVLKRSPAQESALRQFISDVHRPGSSNYHKWLTPEQFGEQFGPSDQDIATVQSWLGSHGFQVTKVQPGKQVLEFSGDVTQMREAFHTQIHKYVVNGETHHANANDPQIPAALAPVVGGFVSLNNFRIKNNVKVLGKATYNTLTHTAQPQWTYGNSTTFVLSPADYAIQYDLQPLYNAGTNGANQTIAIVNDSNINITLVNQFRTLFGLTANPPQVIIDGNDPGIDGINNPDGPNFDSIEAYLDVEWAGSVAPAATIDLVIGGDTALESGLVLAMEHAVYGNIAPVISLSFGECEAGLGSGNGILNSIWAQAAAQGISVFVSTGDSGSAGAGPFTPCDNDNTQAFAVNGLGVNGFASTPYDIAVGGTDFFYSQFNNPGPALDSQIASYWNTTPSQQPAVSLLQVVPEQPWNDSQYGLNIRNFFDLTGSTTIGGGSGGASAVYGKPPWQVGTGVPADLVRDLPDISLFAAIGLNYSYYPICATDGDCQPPSDGNLIQITGVGGTSASTPALAGIMALINQKYGAQGQADFVLYPLKTQFPAAFHDVTNGTNSVPCEFSPTLTANCISVTTPIVLPGPITEGQLGTGTTADYNAAAGYNLATGLGTVDANVMVTDWPNVHFNSTTVSLTSPTAGTNINHGASVTFSGTVTASGGGTPGGNVAIETDSSQPVNQGQATLAVNSGLFNSSNSINFLPGGTYNVWVNYGGDGTNGPSASGKVKITVNPEASAVYFNVADVGGVVVVGPGSTNFPYGTQMILAAEPLPSVDFTACTTTNNCPRFTAPTGTVTFSDNGSAVNTAVVNAEGDAEYNAPWAVGSHSVTAAYSGDASYHASNAGPIAFTIAKATPTLLVSTNSAQGGQPTVFTVQVENTSNSAAESTFQVGFSNPVAAPTGTVSVSGLPGGTLTSGPLSAAVDPSNLFVEGVATITVPSSVTPGGYVVTVSYAGDSNYNSSTLSNDAVIIAAPALLASVTTANTTGSISPTTSLTVNGTVTGQSGHPAPTGFVRFTSSGFILGQLAITPGAGGSDASTFSVTLNSQTLFQGANAMTVEYLGDSNYGSSATTLSINSPLSDFSLVPTSTIVPVNQGSSAMDTINVSSVNNFTGMVSFNCTAPSGITCPAPSAVNLTGGSSTAATLNINASASATPGNNNIRLIATSGAFVHTLAIDAVVVVVPSFTATAPAGPVVVTAGSSGNATITVTPSGGFTGTVAVTCPAPLPPGVTCSPNPLNINVTGNSAVMGQLMLSVAAPSAPGTTAEMRYASTGEYASLQGPPPSGKSGWWKLSAGTGLAAMFLMFLPGRRRYRSSMCLWLVCLLSFALGCGGSSSGGGVVAAATTTKITAPAVTKVLPNTSLSFIISVTSSGAAPNGTVQLFDGATALGSAMQLTNGSATITTSTLSVVGTHGISAHYVPSDTSTLASQSGAVNVTITGNTQVPIQATGGAVVVNGMIAVTIN
jgi:subtilase family serine protease